MNLRTVGVVILIITALVGCSKREVPSTAAKPILVAWVPTTGKSMLPTFPERGLAEAQIGFPYEQLSVGDTVIFWDYTRGVGRFTHHRLVAKQLGNWIAQGDNPETNSTADRPWVTKDNYICRTTGRYQAVVYAP